MNVANLQDAAQKRFYNHGKMIYDRRILMKYFLMIFSVLFLSVSFAAAQGDNAVELQRTEMKKLEKLAGQWKGGGWIQQGATRETFTGTETVQKKLEGLALLVEGRFTNPQGRVIHETLAVLAFAPKNSGYRFRTYLAAGASGEHDLKIVGDDFHWGFETPNGTIRYIIKADDKVWFETGEFSRDGKNWIKFFEMKLDKIK